ncbi:MAG: hypothetical protein PHO67_07715 [Candidatus Omnitrophica bacterium]|nr:hypothetical protein [Candidatus Omnitrophota bacterium]
MTGAPVYRDNAGDISGKPITLGAGALVYIELRPSLDYTTIIGQGKPTVVYRGLFKGFSLPIYSTDNEEIFFTECVPQRWDAASDILVHAHCYLDTANTTKNFQLQLEWEHFTPGVDVVPATSNTVPVETPTGTAAQFKTFSVTFTVDYDIDTPDNVAYDDNLSFRLRRIAASANEIAGEVVITHLGIIFRRNKLGALAI